MEYVKCEDIKEFFTNNKSKLNDEMILLAEENGLKLVLDITMGGNPIIKLMDSDYIEIGSSTCGINELEQLYRDYLKDLTEEDGAYDWDFNADEELWQHIIEEVENDFKDVIENLIFGLVEGPFSDIAKFMESDKYDGFVDTICEQLAEYGFKIYRPMMVESDGEKIYTEYPYDEYTFNDKGE